MNRLVKVFWTILLALGFHLCFFGFESAKLITPLFTQAVAKAIYLFAILYIIDLYLDLRGKMKKFLPHYLKRIYK